jgi:hypothetical protein
VGFRAALDDKDNGKFLTLPEFQLRHLGCSARSQSPNRLRCPGSQKYGIQILCLNLHVTEKFGSSGNASDMGDA